MKTRRDKRRTSSIANALTRAIVRGKRIEASENDRGEIDIWISGEYSGCLERELAEEILGRDE